MAKQQDFTFHSREHAQEMQWMANDAAVHGLRPFDINLIDFAKPANTIPFFLPPNASPSSSQREETKKKIDYTRLRREDLFPRNFNGVHFDAVSFYNA